MATFVLVHGGNMSTDTWNRLTGRNDYPAGGQLGPRYWEGSVSSPRRMATLRLLWRWQMNMTIP